MIFIHETHEVRGGQMEAFAESVRTGWMPLLAAHGGARLLWYWELTHGTGASYQAVTLTAARDFAAWGDLVAHTRDDARYRDWLRHSWTLRKNVVGRTLVPTAWSPLREVDLTAPAAPSPAEPVLYLHDTGFPFPGKLEDYIEALGRVLRPQEHASRMVSFEACFTVAPGTGQHHEVVMLQKVQDWPRFAELLRVGEQGAQRGGWMEEGLKYRDRWESKLLRCAPWSPRQ